MQSLGWVREWIGKDADPSKRKILQSLKFILIIALLAGLFWLVPIGEVLQVISSAQPYLLIIGLLLGIPTIYIKAIKLEILIQKQGFKIPIFELFKINLVVKFYELFLPGAIIGSGLRWVKISSEGNSAEIFAALAFNRLLDVFLVVAIGIFWFLTGMGKTDVNIFVLLFFFAGIAATWLLLIKLSVRFADYLERLPKTEQKARFRQWLISYLDRIFRSIALYGTMTSKELALLIGYGILSEFVSLISFLFIARSVGIPISIADLGWMRSVFLLASLTPFTIAGGLGIREVSFVLMMSAFDISAKVALAFSLLVFARNIFLSLLGGLVELGDTIHSRRELRKT